MLSVMCVVTARQRQWHRNTAHCQPTGGYGSVRHDGERYEVHLCEDCFFETLASLRQSHRSQNMFEDDYVPADPDRFGRVE